MGGSSIWAGSTNRKNTGPPRTSLVTPGLQHDSLLVKYVYMKRQSDQAVILYCLDSPADGATRQTERRPCERSFRLSETRLRWRSDYSSMAHAEEGGGITPSTVCFKLKQDR